MMQSPLISIIIPTYNRAALLTETIESVLGQSFPNLECIIVDDGSTDGTAEVVARYGERIRYVYQRNSGRSIARNKGFELSRGVYVSFLDSDDLLEPDSIQQRVEYLNSNPGAGFVYCGFETIDDDGMNSPLPLNFKRHPPQCGRIFSSLLYFDYIPPATLLIRRECHEGAGGFETSMEPAEDYDWLLRLSRQFTAGYIPQKLARYRIHSGGTSAARLQMATVRVLAKHLDDPQTRASLGQSWRVAIGDHNCAIGNYYYNNASPGKALLRYVKSMYTNPGRMKDSRQWLMIFKSLAAILKKSGPWH
jgi:glycosyltransferase involved in cell wall biosynthesis